MKVHDNINNIDNKRQIWKKKLVTCDVPWIGKTAWKTVFS